MTRAEAKTKNRIAKMTVEREMGRVENVRTDLDQSEWWKGKDQTIFLIQNMEPRWRANCARMLIDRCPAMYRRKRYIWFTWDVFVSQPTMPLGYDNEMPEEVFDEYMRMTDEDIRRIVRKEMDAGKHLDWMRSRPQFIALTNHNTVKQWLDRPEYAGVV